MADQIKETAEVGGTPPLLYSHIRNKGEGSLPVPITSPTAFSPFSN